MASLIVMRGIIAKCRTHADLRGREQLIVRGIRLLAKNADGLRNTETVSDCLYIVDRAYLGARVHMRGKSGTLE